MAGGGEVEGGVVVEGIIVEGVEVVEQVVGGEGVEYSRLIVEEGSGKGSCLVLVFSAARC